MEKAPEWMKAHEEEDSRRFNEVMDEVRELKEILKPIAESYRTASMPGKWIMSLAVFISICVGIWTAFKN